MQQPQAHHWSSSLLAGLCIVIGFGLGVFWNDRSFVTTDDSAPSIVALDDPTPEDTVCCSTCYYDDDQDKPEKKPRTRSFTFPRGLSDENMKRVEEALKRAQEALEKGDLEVPEEFKQHMENFRKQMAEHQKQLEAHLRKLDLNFQGMEGFPQNFNFQGMEGFPRNLPNLRNFSMPEGASGSSVSIMVSRDDGKFTAERREGAQSIKVTGTYEDSNSQVGSIRIKDDGKEKTYKDLKDVPEEHRARVKELIEMGATGRMTFKPKAAPQPKKDSKPSKPAQEREYY